MLPVDIEYERNRRELPRRLVEYASLWVMIFEESSQSGYKQNTLLVARTPSPINILFLVATENKIEWWSSKSKGIGASSANHQ